MLRILRARDAEEKEKTCILWMGSSTKGGDTKQEKEKLGGGEYSLKTLFMLTGKEQIGVVAQKRKGLEMLGKCHLDRLIFLPTH